ncbi:MAG: hypothetical protein KAT70_07950, partial [Thermoplasmata archaeon]|nr:hypothetical protein [Thermoplasmata archaeon]
MKRHVRILSVTIVVLLILTTLPAFLPPAIPEDVPSEDIVIYDHLDGVPSEVRDGVWDSDNGMGYFVAVDGAHSYMPNRDPQWERVNLVNGLNGVTFTDDGALFVGDDGGSPLVYGHSGIYPFGSTVQNGDSDLSTSDVIQYTDQTQESTVYSPPWEWDVYSGQLCGQSFMPSAG